MNAKKVTPLMVNRILFDEVRSLLNASPEERLARSPELIQRLLNAERPLPGEDGGVVVIVQVGNEPVH